MSKKSHRAGGKFKGHTTVTDAAIPVVDALAALDVVTGISISIIEKTRGVAQHTVVTFKRTVSGLEMKVRGNRYVQTFYVYASDLDAVEAMLTERFPKPKKGKKKRRGRRKGRQSHPTAKTWEV